MRKANLSRLPARRVDGIFLSDFEQGEIGPDLFRHACLMGLEGLVSKHRETVYRAGRSPHWIKVKNRQHPAFSRSVACVRPAVSDANFCRSQRWVISRAVPNDGLAGGAVLFFDRLRITVVCLGQRIPGEMQIQVEV